MTLEELRAEYPYLYDTHVHTAESSRCASSKAADMARAYKEAGYAGIMISDHNWGGNTTVDPNLPWEEWIDKFFEGYYHAKEEGDRIGLPVYLSIEATLHGGHDFLLYGFTIDWMKKHPEFRTIDVPELCDLIHSVGGMVIQAHPYREAHYIKEICTYEKYVDGIEMFNAGHLSDDPADDKSIWNDKAVKLANDNNLPGTAGSDQHSTDLSMGGTAFKTPLKDLNDYMVRIRNNEDRILTDGRYWYDKFGQKIELS